jgi:hypothetical protein
VSARRIEHSDWQGEQPRLDRQAVALGARVISVMLLFFFGGFFFAFVYLRVQNVNGRWNHAHAKPSVLLGGLVLGAALVAALALVAVRRRLASNEVARWRPGGVVALLAIAGAIALRIAQLWTLGLDPSSGGYVSVLIGWSAALVVVELGALYWIESLVARSGRLAGSLPEADREAADADQRFLASAAGFTLFWCVLAGIEVLAYVMLDLVH